MRALVSFLHVSALKIRVGSQRWAVLEGLCRGLDLTGHSHYLLLHDDDDDDDDGEAARAAVLEDVRRTQRDELRTCAMDDTRVLCVPGAPECHAQYGVWGVATAALSAGSAPNVAVSRGPSP